MYACLECGVRLPARATGGHREREYCSGRCRQRAYRKQKKQTQEIERLTEGTYALPALGPHVTRDDWRFKRENLLQCCQMLEAERNAAQAEVKVLENEKAMLESSLADREAEITRLRVLLESQAQKRKPRNRDLRAPDRGHD